MDKLIENETVVATVSKNRDEEVRVSRVQISGKPYVSIAVFLKEGGVFRRGVTLSPQVTEDVITALGKALNEASDEDPIPF